MITKKTHALLSIPIIFWLILGVCLGIKEGISGLMGWSVVSFVISSIVIGVYLDLR